MNRMQYDIRTAEQIGSQLNTTLRIFDQAIANPDAIRLTDYEKMLDTDETVGQGYDFLTLGVLIRLGEYHHDDEKVKSFINAQFERMKGNLLFACKEILSAIWAGFSVTEINYNLEHGQTVLESLATYHPASLYFNVDDKGRLLDQGVKQFLLTGSNVDIPTNKCIIYTYNKRFGNLYGRSAFKRIYKNWVIKDPVIKMWARALDRFGTPLVVALVPEGQINDPDNPGKQIPQIDYVIRLLKDIQNQTALAMTASGDNKGDIKALTNGGSGVGEAFNVATAYFNKMIYRGLLLPSLIGDEGSKGSYSLGKKHFDTFEAVLNNIYGELTEVLLEQLVRRLIEYNFGQLNDFGSFPQRELSDDEKKVMGEIFSSMIDKGVLDPNVQADFDYMRASLDMPRRNVLDSAPISSQVLKDYNRYTRAGGSGE